MSNTPFDQWAIVEIMGHQRLAGRVTEQAIGGTNFVRVDVPGVEGSQPFTKLLGTGSIYAITLTDEETARLAAASMRVKPMDEWSARKMLQLSDSPAREPAYDLDALQERAAEQSAVGSM